MGLLAFSILLLILIIAAFVQISKFKKKYTRFMLGKDGANLEKDIMTLYEDNKYMKLSIDKNREDIKELFKKHEAAFQKVGLSNMMHLRKWAENLVLHWLCWMKRTMDLSLIRCIVRTDVILTQNG